MQKDKLSENSFKINIFHSFICNVMQIVLLEFESDWTLRDGVNSLISSISYTRQSNLFVHFLRTEIMSLQVVGDNTVFTNEVFTNGRRLFSVLSHALVQVLESIAYMTCIAQVTWN